MGRASIPVNKIYEIRRLRKQNKSVKEIANIVGFSRRTVTKYTKDMKNIKLKTGGVKVDEKKKAKAIKLKLAGKTIQEISEICDISIGTAKSYTKGVRSSNSKQGKSINFSYEQIREMEQMKYGGATNNEIAHHYRCGETTILRLVGHIKSPNKGPRSKMNEEQDKEMERLYYEEGWTQKRIADYFKVTEQTILRKLKKRRKETV